MIKRIDSELNKNKSSAYHDYIEYNKKTKEFKVVLNGIEMEFINSEERFHAIRKMFLQVKL